MNKAIRWSLRTLGGIAVLLMLNGSILLAAWAILRSITFVDPFAEQAAAHFRRAIPEEIGITSMIAEGSDASLLIAVFFPIINQEVCGGVAFRLSEEAAVQIATHGLAQLEAARIGRGYKNGPKEYHYTYQPWQETPVPSTWTGDGKWAGGFGCLKQYARQFNADPVYKAVREPGAFFTTGSESEMLIIPRLRLLVFTYVG